MMEPPWIANGRALIGISEVKGSKHNPEIVQMWKDIKRGGIKDDETPWCAAFVGAMLERAGIRSTRFESAKSYLDWGIPMSVPAYGCVAVFTREGGGHVGFVVGQTESGSLLILGGNQDDAVNIKAFKKDRVSGYRWHSSFGPVPKAMLPIGSAQLSKSEA